MCLEEFFLFQVFADLVFSLEALVRKEHKIKVSGLNTYCLFLLSFSMPFLSCKVAESFR